MPCGFGSNRNRIAPESGPFEGYELIEVRPKRTLRILRLNESQRKEELVQESEKYAQIGQLLEKAGNIGRHVVEGEDEIRISPPWHSKSSLQNNLQRSKENFAKAKENGAPRTLQDYVLESDAVASSDIDACLPGETSDCQEGRSSQGSVNSPSKISNRSDNSHDSLPQHKNKSKHVRLKLDNHSENKSESSGTGKILPNKDTVIFFFHGVGGSIDMWRAQLDYFSNVGYEIVAADLIGHGLSMAPDEPNAYNFKEIMWDLLAVFDRFFKKQNVVIGHSYG
jgi:hypothetical protein